MVSNAVIAGLIAAGLYAAGTAPSFCVLIGLQVFFVFAFNMARAEIGELKLILDQEAPGWRERNAIWTSTWDWNRVLKRQQKQKTKQAP